MQHVHKFNIFSKRKKLQEKIAQVLENEALLKENQSLNEEKESMLKDKDLADGQIRALTKSLEALQEDLKHKESMVVSIYFDIILSNNNNFFWYNNNNFLL